MHMHNNMAAQARVHGRGLSIFQDQTYNHNFKVKNIRVTLYVFRFKCYLPEVLLNNNPRRADPWVVYLALLGRIM